ncbi:MAG: RHS repeat protein [Candidatus Wallbacteria bacterium]|nr:RHS repeat protein [Candidatus Wallbacteria bacterium]
MRRSPGFRFLAAILALALGLQSSRGLLLAFDAEFDTGHQTVRPGSPNPNDPRPPCPPGVKPRPQSPHSGLPSKNPCDDCNPGHGGFFGDPVDTRTGDFEQSHQDLYIPAPGFPLMVLRTFRTLNKTDGAFGRGWSTGFDQSLQFMRSPEGARLVLYRTGDGVKARFTEASPGSNVYTPPAGSNVTLTLVESRFELRQPWSNTESYDATTGALQELKDLNGNALSFERDSAGKITRVTDSVGRSLVYTYTPSNKVASIVDPAGGVTRYAYDARDHLTQVVNRAGQVTRYAYDSKGRMTSITDARGNTWLTNTYDSQDRVVSQFLNGGTYLYTYNSGGVRLRNPRGTDLNYAYDSEGRVTTIDNPQGRISQTWNLDGRLETYTDRLGRRITYQYDAAGNITRLSNPSGKATTAEYDPRFNLPTRVTDASGFVVTYTYDDRGNRTSSTTPDGTTSYGYDSRGYVTSITDAAGGVTRFTYDAHGNVATIQDAAGNTSRRTYDLLGRVLSATDARGKTTTFSYNASGFLLSQTDALGLTTRWTYDAENNMTSYTNEVGGTTTFEYDAFNRMVALTNPMGGQTRYDYDASGSLIEVTSPNGGRTRYTYDAAGLISRLVDPLGNSRIFVYDANGHLTRETDARGKITDRAYDVDGNMTRETDALGNSVTVEYDAEGAPTKMIDQLGRALVMTRGFEGRLLSYTDPLGRVTTYGYDALGQVTSVTGSRGTTRTLVRDLRGLVTASVNDLGERSETDYGPTGKVLATRDATGVGQTFEYDDEDRISATVSPNGVRTAYERDGAGRVTALIRAAGTPDQVRDELTYDLMGHLISATRAVGTSASVTVRYSYDANGNPVSINNGRGKTWRFAYDLNDRIVRETDPLGRVTEHLYDGEANRTGDNLPSGRKIRLELDAAGQPISTTYLLADSTVERQVTRVYDAASQILSVRDATVDISQSFDAGSRLTRVGHGHLGQAVAVTQNTSGSQVSIALEGVAGSAQTIVYDALGRMTEIQPPAGGPLRIRYNPRGQRQSVALPCGVTATFQYQPSGFLRSYAYSRTDASAPLTFTFSADRRDNFTSIQDSEGTRTFVYDALDRLVRADYPDQAYPFESFTYDASGNRTSLTTAGGTTTYVYDDVDQLLSATGPAPGQVRTYEWTPDGQLASVQRSGASGPTRFTWSVGGQLLSVTEESGAVTTHAYEPHEAAGLRWKTAREGVEQLRQLWGLWGNPLAELDPAGALQRLYVHGPSPDRFHGQFTGGVASWALTDQNDSVREVVGPSGATLESRRHAAFGKRRGAAEAQQSPLDFAARRESAGGLVYMRARWYDPDTGRFLTQDPVRSFDGASRYAYASDNPVRYTDPFGLLVPVAIGAYFLLGVVADYAVSYATQDKHQSFSDYYWSGEYSVTDAAIAGGTSVLSGGAARVVSGTGKLAFAGRTALVSAANTAGQSLRDAYNGKELTLKGTATRFLGNATIFVGATGLGKLSSSIGSRLFGAGTPKNLYSYSDRVFQEGDDFGAKYGRVWMTSAEEGAWLTSRYNPLAYLRRVVHLGRLSPFKEGGYSRFVAEAGSNAAKNFQPADIGIGDFWKYFGRQFHTKIGVGGFTLRPGTKILDQPIQATAEKIRGSYLYDVGLNVPWLAVGYFAYKLNEANTGDTPVRPCR